MFYFIPLQDMAALYASLYNQLYSKKADRANYLRYKSAAKNYFTILKTRIVETVSVISKMRYGLFKSGKKKFNYGMFSVSFSKPGNYNEMSIQYNTPPRADSLVVAKIAKKTNESNIYRFKKPSCFRLCEDDAYAPYEKVCSINVDYELINAAHKIMVSAFSNSRKKNYNIHVIRDVINMIKNKKIAKFYAIEILTQNENIQTDAIPEKINTKMGYIAKDAIYVDISSDECKYQYESGSYAKRIDIECCPNGLIKKIRIPHLHIREADPRETLYQYSDYICDSIANFNGSSYRVHTTLSFDAEGILTNISSSGNRYELLLKYALKNTPKNALKNSSENHDVVQENKRRFCRRLIRHQHILNQSFEEMFYYLSWLVKSHDLLSIDKIKF